MTPGRAGRAGLGLVGPGAAVDGAVLPRCRWASWRCRAWASASAGRAVPGWTLANYARFFDKPYFHEALLNSLEVTALVTVLSVLLAYPLAWILAFRVPQRWQRAALLLAILPFWTSYLVRSYSWLLVLSPEGVVPVDPAPVGLDLGVQLVSNRTGTVIGFVHFFTMLLRSRSTPASPRSRPSYLRAAADLGASPLQAFLRVTLPLSLPGVVVGAFLTFVLAIGDYITPQILGGNRELLLPQAIMLQIGRQADFPMAAALSLVLMLVVSLAYLACARWLRLERTVMARPGKCWRRSISALGLPVHLPAGARAGPVLVPGLDPAGAALHRPVAALVPGGARATTGCSTRLGSSLLVGVALLAARDPAGLPRRLRPRPRPPRWARC